MDEAEGLAFNPLEHASVPAAKHKTKISTARTSAPSVAFNGISASPLFLPSWRLAAIAQHGA
jgi:hypothetical protein